MKQNKLICCVLFLIVLCLITCYYFIMCNWFIAHALGNYKGISYTNSLEAFKQSYMMGFRKFEVDLTLTNNQEIIVFHGYHKKIYDNLNISVNQFSYDDFISGKVTQNMPVNITTMSLSDFIKLMRKYKKIQVMLHIHSNNDAKITEYVIQKIIKEANSSSQILDRFSIGINFEQELKLLNKYPILKNRHYYVRKKSKRPAHLKNIQEIINYLNKNNIKAVSMPYKAVIANPKEVKVLRKNGIYIYSFTQNNLHEILKMKKIGVHTIGTDGNFSWDKENL